MVLTFRRRTASGYLTHQYLVFGDADPVDDPQLEVKPGDLLVRFNSGLINEYIREDTNTEWVLRNTWDYILDKPTEFVPQVHELTSDRHTGNLPIQRVNGHTLNNPVHVQIRLESVLLGSSGNARASSTSI